VIPDDPHSKTIKLPVRIVDGVPQPFYGPGWPRLKDGVIGDLILPAYAFLNREDEVLLSAPLGAELLPKGTRLLAAVSSQAIGEGILSAGERLFAEMPDGRFVELRLEEGLRIQLRGTKKARLDACRCLIPS
jgi:hypothetical protein